MRAMRRFLEDESGITLPLAVMMVVLIGVMGAGLLTFVSRDLNAVVEINSGQRAFEVADAGIAAAKRQLASNVDRTKYDGGADDYQWSAAKGGMTFNDLDGTATTSDSAKVTIEYKSAGDEFLAISTGTYGGSKRKIEAQFTGVVTGGGGDSIGHPLYYTPSNIRIEKQVSVNAISMFTEGDILIQGVTTPLSFAQEWESPGDTLSIPNTKDELCDWKTDVPLSGCFVDATGTWNTVGRTIQKKSSGTTDKFQLPGFAAEGKICGFTAGTAKGQCETTEASAADGVYGYDSTTGSKTMSRVSEGYPNPWGNNLKFVDKGNQEPNPSGTISYPFPRPTPIPANFKKQACLPATSPCLPSTTGSTKNYYRTGSLTAAQWNNVLGSDPNRIVFVDAQNNDITFNPGGAPKGILVVWCGQLTQVTKFQGIILNLRGDGSAFGSTNCSGDPTKGGIYSNGGVVGATTYAGTECQCWIYSDGGTATRAGLTFTNGSSIKFLPSGDWGFLSDFFQGPPPTSFEVKSWRELYQ